jgi:hypothetical protein
MSAVFYLMAWLPDLSWLDSIVITEGGGIDSEPLYCGEEREMIIDAVIDSKVFIEYPAEAVVGAIYGMPLGQARIIERIALAAAEGMALQLRELKRAPKGSFAEAFALARIYQFREQLNEAATKLGLDTAAANLPKSPITTLVESLPTL